MVGLLLGTQGAGCRQSQPATGLGHAGFLMKSHMGYLWVQERTPRRAPGRCQLGFGELRELLPWEAPGREQTAGTLQLCADEGNVCALAAGHAGARALPASCARCASPLSTSAASFLVLSSAAVAAARLILQTATAGLSYRGCDRAPLPLSCVSYLCSPRTTRQPLMSPRVLLPDTSSSANPIICAFKIEKFRETRFH